MLWGISWVNVKLMLEDSSRVLYDDSGTGNKGDDENLIKMELKNKDDIKSFIKTLNKNE